MLLKVVVSIMPEISPGNDASIVGILEPDLQIVTMG